MNTGKRTVAGYLPDERPPIGKLLLYALQQVIVMFPATVTVALVTGFQVSTTIFASGLATICFILITGKKIPLYYGSSFSYLTAVSSLMASQSIIDKLSPAAQGAAFSIFRRCKSGYAGRSNSIRAVWHYNVWFRFNSRGSFSAAGWQKRRGKKFSRLQLLALWQ